MVSGLFFFKINTQKKHFCFGLSLSFIEVDPLLREKNDNRQYIKRRQSLFLELCHLIYFVSGLDVVIVIVSCNFDSRNRYLFSISGNLGVKALRSTSCVCSLITCCYELIGRKVKFHGRKYRHQKLFEFIIDFVFVTSFVVPNMKEWKSPEK